jgi:two-component system chemotaxis response regulator CheY
MFKPDANFVVVDDMSAMVLVIKSKLKELGFTQVQTFSGADAAWEYMTKPGADGKAVQVDVILSDYVMPDVNGLDFLARVRGHEHLKHVPFLMITAEADNMSLERVSSLRLDGFAQKPITLQMLQGLLSKTYELLKSNGRIRG